MYWEVSGNPQGVPVVFLHGGPGAGASEKNRQYFDPDFYRIVVFDQRGCGRSKPLGDLEENTTQHLVMDMEALREHLSIDAWVIFGASWGSTLGLYYAQCFPHRCLHLILRGIFLGTPWENQWFMEGARRFFPAQWQAFLKGLGVEGSQEDYLTALCDQLLSKNDGTYTRAAQAYEAWAATLYHFEPWGEFPQAPTEKEATVQESPKDPKLVFQMTKAMNRVESHYIKHKYFLENTPILENMKHLESLSGHMIQGRYDMICPPLSAWKVAQSWPKATLEMVESAGHGSHQGMMMSRIIAATTLYKNNHPTQKD